MRVRRAVGSFEYRLQSRASSNPGDLHWRNRSCLLADDNEATCTLITALLRSDFVVEVATRRRRSDRETEMQAVRGHPARPAHAGRGRLCRARVISARNAPTCWPAVLVVTASLAAREMQRVSGYNVCGVVAEPFEVDALFYAVRQCAGEHGSPCRGPLISGGMLILIAEVLKRV